MSNPVTNLLGGRQLPWLLLAALVAVALTRALGAGDDTPLATLSSADRREVGTAAAALEPAWRAIARRDFPGDAWSQDDHFHSFERAWAYAEALRRGVSPREIFRAIDEDLRANPPSPPRKATASPCKPRPFYD